jgi:hypothetical protein
MAKTLRQTIAGLVDHFQQFPERLAAAAKERHQQTVLIEQEAERLDRIRHPEKYRGK